MNKPTATQVVAHCEHLSALVRIALPAKSADADGAAAKARDLARTIGERLPLMRAPVVDRLRERLLLLSDTSFALAEALGATDELRDKLLAEGHAAGASVALRLLVALKGLLFFVEVDGAMEHRRRERRAPEDRDSVFAALRRKAWDGYRGTPHAYLRDGVKP